MTGNGKFIPPIKMVMTGGMVYGIVFSTLKRITRQNGAVLGLPGLTFRPICLKQFTNNHNKMHGERPNRGIYKLFRFLVL